ncbi:MAG TPA: hypothetical protein VIJ14_09990, partial [Rhabdochlamydiaceae bacterium]
EYAKTAHEILAMGKSLAAVCAALDVSRQSIHNWRKEQTEFNDAIERGLQKSQAHWEDIGMDGVTGSYEKFNAAPWIFTMKNRFREDYKEDKEDKNANDDKSVLEKIITGEIKIKHD